MKSIKENLRKHYITKFGETIFEDLISPDFIIKAENIKPKGLGKEAVDEQMDEIVQKGLLSPSDRSNFKWAFDFPGWIGKLNLDQEHRKEIMLIQLEPHVERFDYQIVYELAEETGEKEFGIELSKEKLITRSTRPIWDNATRLLATKKQKDLIFKEKQTDVLYSILDKLYISDMCHFAPQGPTTLLKKLPWNQIRKSVAEAFMFEEINLINPRLLIASGGNVIKAVDKLFSRYNRKLLIRPSDLQPNNYQNFPYLYEYDIEGRKQHILFAPHIGTVNPTNMTFWKNSVDAFNILLRDHGILNETPIGL
jgi:hypothetical protein